MEVSPDIPGPGLKRSLGLTLLTLYGIGVTVGAGIYVLVGKVSGEAGFFAPWSFLVAAILAGLTALSYGELASRFPKSAGAAIYFNEAFGSPAVSTIVGLMVTATGLVSAAVITLGFVGYLRTLVPVPEALATIGMIGILFALAAWGITQSLTVSAVVTVLEVGGLLLVIAGGFGDAVTAPALGEVFAFPGEFLILGGILNGAVLAFFAFIGFEDMVNVAEEVVAPERTIPRAILLTLLCSGGLYMAISIVAVTTVPLDRLIESDAPLALVFETTTGFSPAILSSIAVFAVLNGALIQIIMGSRVIYGLADQGWLPRILARVEARTQTPVIATGLVATMVATLALAFPIVGLASVTSYITLLVFTVINIALIRLRVAGRITGPGLLPIWVPGLGALASLGLVVFTLIH